MSVVESEAELSPRMADPTVKAAFARGVERVLDLAAALLGEAAAEAVRQLVWRLPHPARRGA